MCGPVWYYFLRTGQVKMEVVEEKTDMTLLLLYFFFFFFFHFYRSLFFWCHVKLFAIHYSLAFFFIALYIKVRNGKFPAFF